MVFSGTMSYGVHMVNARGVDPQGNTAPPVIHAFTADPATVRTGAPSNLNWAVTRATALSLEPGVGDVTGTTGVVVNPTTTTTYTLTASNAAGAESDQVTVRVDDTVTVQGNVIGIDGLPASGVGVTVPAGATTTTAADGSFSITGVVQPYTITLLHPNDPLSVTYIGLSRTDPTLVVPGPPLGQSRTASIYGTVSAGTTFPQPPDHRTHVSYGSAAVRRSVAADSASGAFQMLGLTWHGDESVGALHALQWSLDGDGLPLAYTGHGQRPLTLRAALVGYLSQDMALLPVTTARLSGTVRTPSGYTTTARSASVMFPEGGHITTATETAPTDPTFSYATPAIAGAHMAVAVMAAAPSGEGSFAVRTDLQVDASGVILEVAPAPGLTSPPDGASGVDHDTTFTWSAPAGGVTVVHFSGPSGAPSFYLLTEETTASIPDLHDLGIALPSEATYRWQAFTMASFADVDASAADDDGFLSSWPLNPSYRPKSDGAWAVSKQWEVTTAR